MIRVKVELVPNGHEPGTRTLHELFIANDGSGGPVVGNYDVYLDVDPRAYPHLRHDRSLRPGWVGRIEGVVRTPDHRLRITAKALELVAEPGARSAA